ncbi:unnamed protein product [Caenorhabditis nigoni]
MQFLILLALVGLGASQTTGRAFAKGDLFDEYLINQVRDEMKNTIYCMSTIGCIKSINEFPFFQDPNTILAFRCVRRILNAVPKEFTEEIISQVRDEIYKANECFAPILCLFEALAKFVNHQTTDEFRKMAQDLARQLFKCTGI